MTKFLRNSKSSVLNRMIVFIGVMLIFGVAYSAITGCDDANRANEVVVDPHLEDGTQPPGGVTPPPSDEIPPDYGTPPSETDTTAPTILERTPLNEAAGVATNTLVTVKFSEPMNAETVTAVNEAGMPVNFTLGVVDGEPLAGVVSYDADNNVATFAPQSALRVNANYVATVTTGVADTAGNALAGNDQWSFSTPTVLLETRTIQNNSGLLTAGPKVAVDAIGNSVVVWGQQRRIEPDDVDSVFASNYSINNDSWGPAASISYFGGRAEDSTNHGYAMIPDPNVASSSNGNAVSVWRQDITVHGFGTTRIMALFYLNGSVIGPNIVDNVPAAGTVVSSPRVAISGDGNHAIIVWLQAGNVMYRKYDLSVNPPNLETIQTAAVAGSGIIQDPDVAMNEDGNSTIVWNFNNIIEARYCLAGHIQCARLARITALMAGASLPHIAMDPQGNAIAVWEQNNSVMFNMYKATVAAPAWGSPTQIPPIVAGAKMKAPQVAVDSNGTATIIWRQEEAGLGLNKIYAAYCPLVEGEYVCAATIQIDSNLAIPAFPMDIAVAGTCSPMVVFKQAGMIWYNKYDKASSTWPDPTHLTEHGIVVGSPHIAMAENCLATIVWKQAGHIMGRIME